LWFLSGFLLIECSAIKVFTEPRAPNSQDEITASTVLWSSKLGFVKSIKTKQIKKTLIENTNVGFVFRTTQTHLKPGINSDDIGVKQLLLH
jgi:hypothetical protein